MNVGQPIQATAEETFFNFRLQFFFKCFSRFVQKQDHIFAANDK